VVEMCRAALTEVYGDNSFAGAATSSGKEANGVGDVPDNYRPIGGDAVLAKSLEVATQPKVAPVIAPFEKLSLLGS
jgi:elongator complex protein 1